MRTKFRSSSKLEILQHKGNAGHNVLDLKEMVSSARIYARPLQKDLSLEETFITGEFYPNYHQFSVLQYFSLNILTLSLENLQRKGLECVCPLLLLGVFPRSWVLI